jgi:hypothetical protein
MSVGLPGRVGAAARQGRWAGVAFGVIAPGMAVAWVCGLRNLAARAVAQGGRLATDTEGDRFELTVQVPLPSGA